LDDFRLPKCHPAKEVDAFERGALGEREAAGDSVAGFRLQK